MEDYSAVAKYSVFDDTLRFYNALLSDIENATRYIYIEIYRFTYHSLGKKFRDTLLKKVHQGVKVRMLLDSWGTSPNQEFFSPLTRAGAEVRFFEKIRFNLDYFTRSHRRNHRKIIVVDDQILYLGSANITDYNVVWRELIVRMEGELASVFKDIFNSMFDIYNRYLIYSPELTAPITYKGFDIIRDVPSQRHQNIKKHFIKLIHSAHKSIFIETPYFLPSFLLRSALIKAAKKGVKVFVLLPKHSDVRLVDLLRNKYLGPLTEKGIKFFMYIPQNLHSKLLLVDDNSFAFGSPNFDYRSFSFQHEIVLSGHDPRLIKLLKEHVNETLQDSEPFDYLRWKRRPYIEKIFEWLIVPFRQLL
ncbi:MAG TPA: phospholipase D-like domain-containing protein [Bacteroidales bacterium]|jgi:cardiolipin synthase|nr:phospholipase D-like domain-containing protein [Bacteroidales bacterium]